MIWIYDKTNLSSGIVAREDIERIGVNIRDWIRQTGQKRGTTICKGCVKPNIR